MTEPPTKEDRRLARLVKAAQRARVANAKTMTGAVAGDLKARAHPRRWFAERRATAYDFVCWAIDEVDRKPLAFQLKAADLVERLAQEIRR